jgi:branched-chain amino acid transport system substrate-binding protein
MVAALEKTDFVGTIGRIKFYGRDSQYTHAIEYGPGLVTGVFIQWQHGKQMTVWPTDKANTKVSFPTFIKLPQQASAR